MAGRSCTHSAADWSSEPFPFPRARDRQDDVGEGSSRRQVEIGLHMEFQVTQCSRAGCGVGMRQQQVGAEPDQGAHAIRLDVLDRTIQIVRCHPAHARRAKRALVSSKRLPPLVGRAQIDAGDLVHRHLCQMHIAARHVDAAGQGMHDRVRTRGLRRVGMLLEPGPGEVGQGAMMPEQMRGCANGARFDAGDARGLLRGEPAAQRGEAIERQTAGIGPSRPAIDTAPNNASLAGGASYCRTRGS